MAKKKTKNKQLNPVIKAELLGITYIVISTILFFGFGLIGRVFNSIVLFFIGYGAYPLYLILFVIGIVYMIGRKVYEFDFFKKLSVIMFTISIMLIMSLIQYDKDETFIKYSGDLLAILKDYIGGDSLGNVVGGIFGYAITSVSVMALTVPGVVVVCIGTILASLAMFFNKPMREYFKRDQKPNKSVAKKAPVKKESKPEVEKELKEERIFFNEEIDRKQAIYNYEDETVVDEPPVEEVAKEIKDEDLPIDTTDYSATTVTAKDSKKYKLPPLDLLFDNTEKRSNEDKLEIQNKAKLLVSTLGEFGVTASVVAVHVGPTVTQFEIEIKAGTKVSKVTGLSRELALALAAKDVLIQAPIPQKSTVGIEIPNVNASLVTLKEILKSIPKSESNKTVFGLGKDIMGKPVYASLNKMPHMLVAGATGSGKSVCINSIIISIAMRAKPDEVKMLLVDPKKVELSGFNGLPHLLAPVVTNPRKAAVALQKIVTEMERRYELFSEKGSKNIESYNAKMIKNNLKQSVLPYIVVIVDELADLMLVASKEVEDSIMRITQMARASGIHLIVATQRPSTDIITGVIKSNIPSRIAFGVSSSIDSRTILDSTGAEKLLGKGDMLFVPMGASYATRIQGAFLSEEEVENVVHYCTQQQIAQFDENLVNLEEKSTSEGVLSEDELYGEVLEFVMENGSASTSLLQRRFRIGYNRASRLIDDLEANGVIGPQNGSKPRELIED